MKKSTLPSILIPQLTHRFRFHVKSNKIKAESIDGLWLTVIRCNQKFTYDEDKAVGIYNISVIVEADTKGIADYAIRQLQSWPDNLKIEIENLMCSDEPCVTKVYDSCTLISSDVTVDYAIAETTKYELNFTCPRHYLRVITSEINNEQK